MSTMTIELQPLRGPSDRTLARRRPAPTRPQQELFARRRAAVVLALIGGLTVAGLMVRTGPDSSGGDPASAFGRAPAASSAPAARAPGPVVSPLATYLVQPGDTLWSIAQLLVAEGADVAKLVDQLDELNGGDALEVGQLLVLPS